LTVKANLSDTVWIRVRESWNLKGDLRSQDAKRLCRALFRYCIAIAHSPQYELDHKDSLAQDWPRIPVSKDKDQFEEIVRLGEQVVCLLNPLTDATAILKTTLGKDMNSLGVVRHINGASVSEADLLVKYSYYGAATGRWDQRSIKEGEAQRSEWDNITGDLFLDESVFLSHLPPEIWRYELGGYPVIKKWLGYRQANRRNGAPLSLPELDKLREIIHRIAALLALRPLLDAAYEKASEQAWMIDDFQLEPSPIST
jgi:Type ISP C-terminal specificity domain